MNTAANVLVVDDDFTNIALLRAILNRLGYSVCAAKNGAEAVDVYQAENPDVIFMDIMMPVMNGYEAAKKIRELEKDSFTPIIFITALTDDDSLAKCIESGGNDFLTKPYNTIHIEAKLKSFLQLKELYRSVHEKTINIEKHNNWLESEYRISEQVINKVTKKDHLRSENIKVNISPKALFNGDMLMVTKTPDNITRILIGDFTGHGMSGAIGSIPVAGIFYSMTEKGFSLEVIIKEINNRLADIMPVGLFLAAAVMDYDPHDRRLRVWNGGSPDISIFSQNAAGINVKMTSQNYPFAAVGPEQFTTHIEEVFVNEGDRIIAYTDGALTFYDEKTNKLKSTDVESMLSVADNSDSLFDDILQSLVDYRDGEMLIDDVTLVELKAFTEVHDIAKKDSRFEQSYIPDELTEWSADFCFDGTLLKSVDPVPMIIQSLSEFDGMSAQKQPMYLIIRELFANALDHGLLRLDSRIKNEEHGFEKFYNEKERRLQDFEGGWIRLGVSCENSTRGGQLTVTVKDSGKGFDFVELEKTLVEDSYHGRGMQLIRQLCSEVKYLGQGNEVLAVYHWEVSPR